MKFAILRNAYINFQRITWCWFLATKWHVRVVGVALRRNYDEYKRSLCSLRDTNQSIVYNDIPQEEVNNSTHVGIDGWN